MVDSGAGTIKPIGLGGVVTNGILTCSHVFQSIQVASVSGQKVYMSSVRREVKSTIGMLEFKPGLSFGPSARNRASFPVSSDFVIIPLPDQFSTLSIKSGGKVSFGSESQAVVGGFYKQVAGVWRFYITAGVANYTNLQLDDQVLPGVSIWTGHSTYGASGCPLYSVNGEFVGLNVGVVGQKGSQEKQAIYVRASTIMGYYLTKAKYRGAFSGKRFGLADIVSKQLLREAVRKQKIESHTTPDGQRDLDPDFWDDYDDLADREEGRHDRDEDRRKEDRWSDDRSLKWSDYDEEDELQKEHRRPKGRVLHPARRPLALPGAGARRCRAPPRRRPRPSPAARA